jgi:spore coat polysaccharide biosynthesis protein SpsF
MRIVAVVQARVSSTRLPAKVLLDLGGKTALQRCVDRVARIEGIADLVIATTTNPEDEIIVRLARRLGVATYRGSETDVLSRYVEAARGADAEAIVRCTSDCPLLDPAVASDVVRTFQRGGADFAANHLVPNLPRGQETEIASREALERAHRDATSPEEREHVMPHIYRRQGEFRCVSVVTGTDETLPRHRWTLDTIDDYRFLSVVYDELGPRGGEATMADVLALLESHPEITRINANVKQKALSE